MTLRPLDPPRPIVVDLDGRGAPRAVTAGGRRRVVIAVRDDWLVEDLWWTDAPVERHYHELVVAPGRVMVVYRDRRGGGWHVHPHGG